jgi:hypothetical protein
MENQCKACASWWVIYAPPGLESLALGLKLTQNLVESMSISQIGNRRDSCTSHLC